MGEHGVGIGEREYLVEELGDITVEFMRMIKKAVDLLGLFSPGKVSKSFSHFSLSIISS
jgi:D-lactate dehydrogenase (cytochrome)